MCQSCSALITNRLCRLRSKEDREMCQVFCETRKKRGVYAAEVFQLSAFSKPCPTLLLPVQPSHAEPGKTPRVRSLVWPPHHGRLSRMHHESQGREQGSVWINEKQFFEGVPEAVWKFPIDGYLPAQR